MNNEQHQLGPRPGNDPDLRERRIALVDRSGAVAEAITRAAREKNEKELLDKKTGQQATARVVFEVLEPAADSQAQLLAPTIPFTLQKGKESIEMLGTYSPVSTLDWAVIAQKKQRDAYQDVYDMQRTARLLALLVQLTLDRERPHRPGAALKKTLLEMFGLTLRRRSQ